MPTNGPGEPEGGSAGTSSTLVPAASVGTKELIIGAIFVGIISLTLFSLLAHNSMVWEQDQASKAAKILYMIQHAELLRPFDPSAAQIYQDAFFTFYYIVCALIYKLVGGDLLGLMNHLSAVFGAMGLIGLTTAIRHAYGISWYVSLPLFLSVPILVITFSYGNEVALSFGLFGAALGMASFGGKSAKFVSPILMVLACFARADMVLMCPFWLGWTLMYGLGLKDKKETLRSIAVIAVVFVSTALFYFAIVFRGHIPRSLGFGLGRVGLLLWIGNVSYPFCPSLVVIGGIGALLFLFRRRKEGLLHFLLLVPLIVYFKNLYSPKYIIAMSIFYVVPTAWLLLTSRRWLRTVMIAGIAFWWIFSISNFGFFGPKMGPYWYLPTADNAIPTGSYLNFYRLMHGDFYVERYQGELEYVDLAVVKLCAATPQEPQVLWGTFNFHSLFYVTMKRGHFDDYTKYFRWDPDLKLPEDPRTRIYMIQTGYLWPRVFPPAEHEKFTEWLMEGRVREVIGDGGPFPQMIEIGPLVPAGTDRPLSERITFAGKYYFGSLSMPRKEMLAPYATLSWVRRDQIPANTQPSVYEDGVFAAFEQAMPGGRIFGLHFPKLYFRFSEEDTRRLMPKSDAK